MLECFLQLYLKPFKTKDIRYRFSKMPIASTHGVFTPLLRVELASRLLFIRFVEVCDDQVKICLKGNMKKIDIPDTPRIDKNILLDTKHGRFAIMLKISYCEPAVEKILTKWRQIELIGGFVDVIKRTNLKLVSVQSEEVMV